MKTNPCILVPEAGVPLSPGFPFKPGNPSNPGGPLKNKLYMSQHDQTLKLVFQSSNLNEFMWLVSLKCEKGS